MRHWWFKIKKIQLSFLSAITLVSTAHAHTRHHSASHIRHHAFSRHKTRRVALETTHHRHHIRKHMRLAMLHRHHHHREHVIQCVAYAKQASGIMLRGNARDWWYNAIGNYDRGSVPEQGSVLNFRGTRRMPLGHVAVVRNVIDNRTITIDQSHWARAGISHNVRVIDVSLNNDWSAVRVSLNNHSMTYGSVYPTYGFIYPHHNHNVMQVSLNNRSTVYNSFYPIYGSFISHKNAGTFVTNNQNSRDGLSNKT